MMFPGILILPRTASKRDSEGYVPPKDLCPPHWVEKPRAGPEGDGSGPAQGLKVGVKGGLLPPGSLEKPPQFHFTPGAPANRFPTRAPSPLERKKTSGASAHG